MEAAPYTDLAAHCREHVHADGVVLIVLNGDRGSSIAIEATPLLGLSLPAILRVLADQMDPPVGL